MENLKGVTSGQGLYLYCFFKGTPPLIPEQGIEEGNPPFVLSYRDLCALVSRVPLATYHEEALNERIQDPKWLLPKIKRHEEIVRSVTGPVIPVKFGILYTSRERVLTVLRSGYAALYAFLEFVRDKEEWGVKVYADDGVIQRRVADFSEPLQELDRRLSSATPGEAYLLGRKRADLVQQEAKSLFDRLADEIYHQVLPFSVEGRRSALLSRRATGKEGEMILNAAFLLRKSEVTRFTEQLDVLAARHERHGLSLEVSGPWPPYNFCPDFEAVKEEEAR